MEAGFARLCFGGGKAGSVRFPPSCIDPECRRATSEANSEAALQRAIEKGIIDP